MTGEDDRPAPADPFTTTRHSESGPGASATALGASGFPTGPGPRTGRREGRVDDAVASSSVIPPDENDMRGRNVTEPSPHELAEELIRAAEAANAAIRAKSAFLANMSHELRTPLSAIIGFSELLDERLFGELTAKQGEYVRNIIDSGRHLLHMVNSVLDLSKIEAGKANVVLSTFPISSLVTGSLGMVREKCLKNGIVLSTDIAGSIEGLPVTTDERKLKQVMFNLLANAVNFSPRGASITVRATRQGDDVLISVTDTGPGVAVEHQQHLFEEFYQVDRGPAGKTPGIGLGLSIARRIVEMLGGRIWMESKGDGEGCTFWFTIPIGRTSARPGPIAPQPQDPLTFEI